MEEDTRTVASAGSIVKPSSETLPQSHSRQSSRKTLSESLPQSPSRQSSRRTRSSKSSVSMTKRSSFSSPQREESFTHYSNKSQVVQAEKPEIPKECRCGGTDLYSKVLGPTADETILTGLQTVIDLCSKLRTCGDREESGDEEPEREQDIPEKDVPSFKASKSQTERSLMSAGFQVNPSIRVAATQTASLSEVVSETLHSVGVTPEMISKIVQTSAASLHESQQERKKSLASMFIQTSDATLKSQANQTTYHSLTESRVMSNSNSNINSNRSYHSNDNSNGYTNGNSNGNSNGNNNDNSNGYSNGNSNDKSNGNSNGYSNGYDNSLLNAVDSEHRMISTPDPPNTTKICKCCRCSSSNFRKTPKESRSSVDRLPCVCGSKKLSKCRCDKSKRFAEDDQVPSEVKYAVTKISKFKEFTTFEITKSTKNQPRQMPKHIEGVFVLRKKNGSSKGEVNGTYESSKSKSNGLKNGRSSRNGTKSEVLRESDESRGDISNRRRSGSIEV